MLERQDFAKPCEDTCTCRKRHWSLAALLLALFRATSQLREATISKKATTMSKQVLQKAACEASGVSYKESLLAQELEPSIYERIGKDGFMQLSQDFYSRVFADKDAQWFLNIFSSSTKQEAIENQVSVIVFDWFDDDDVFILRALIPQCDGLLGIVLPLFACSLVISQISIDSSCKHLVDQIYTGEFSGAYQVHGSRKEKSSAACKAHFFLSTFHPFMHTRHNHT